MCYNLAVDGTVHRATLIFSKDKELDFMENNQNGEIAAESMPQETPVAPATNEVPALPPKITKENFYDETPKAKLTSPLEATSTTI